MVIKAMLLDTGSLLITSMKKMQVSPPTAPGPQMLPTHYLLLLSQGLKVAQAGLNFLYK